MSAANTMQIVHLRRALLLFAIVLGMAALVASLSRPIEQRRSDTTPQSPREPGPATATPGPSAGPAPELPRTVSFQASEDQSMKLRAGDAATVDVAVSEAGTVEIPDMGLSSAADPVTPARFDVLATRPGRYELIFIPARGERARPAGSLVVTSRG
jgi:hypothetical protein